MVKFSSFWALGLALVAGAGKEMIEYRREKRRVKKKAYNVLII